MITYGKFPNSKDYIARVVLSDGSIAGEGYGPSAECAKFYAVSSALRSETPRHVTAGKGHLVFLSAQDARLLSK